MMVESNSLQKASCIIVSTAMMLVVNENLDTPDSIVDHSRVVKPEDVGGWLRDVLHNAHLSNDYF